MFNTKERDSTRCVQNLGVSIVANIMKVASAKDKNPIVSDMMFYGVIEEIWELDYHNFWIPMFKCIWVENNSGIKVDDLDFTLVNFNRIGSKSDSFILASQAKQVFYIEDPLDPAWAVVLNSPSREYFESINSDDLGEAEIHHPCFSKGMAPMDVDYTNENEQSILRDDCDRT